MGVLRLIDPADHPVERRKADAEQQPIPQRLEYVEVLPRQWAAREGLRVRTRTLRAEWSQIDFSIHLRESRAIR